MSKRRGSEEAYAQEYNAMIDKTPRRNMSYDVKCEDLARDFLDEERPYTEAELADLAQQVQTVIENFLAGRRPQRDPAE